MITSDIATIASSLRESSPTIWSFWSKSPI